MTSKSLFTCIPPQGALAAVKKETGGRRLPKLTYETISRQHMWPLGTLSHVHLLCVQRGLLQTKTWWRQSPVNQILADLYVEEDEAQTFASYADTAPRFWFRYVDDTFMVIEKAERTAFFTHLNASDPYLQFHRGPPAERWNHPIPRHPWSAWRKTGPSLSEYIVNQHTRTGTSSLTAVTP